MLEGEVLLREVAGDLQSSCGEALAHVECAVAEVAEFVGEFGVVEHDEAVDVVFGIAAGGDVADEVVAEGFDGEFVREGIGIDDVAGGFGDFCAAEAVPEAVDEEARHLCVGEAHGVEHAEPVDAMGGDEDVLADEVDGALGPDGGEVGECRVSS